MKANIYFAGAGGIGMAALERYFLSKGCKVAGYDRTPSELTHALEQEGVEITFTDDPDNIPLPFRDRETTLVVYTPAIHDDNRILSMVPCQRVRGCEACCRAGDDYPRVEVALLLRHPRQNHHIHHGRPYPPDPGDRLQRLPRRCGPQLQLKLPSLHHQPLFSRGG